MKCPKCGKKGDESEFRESRGKGIINRPRTCLECWAKSRKKIYANYYKKHNAERRARWHNDPEYREKNRKAVKRYQERNKEELAQKQKDIRLAKRKVLIEFYGGVCACCGENRYEFLCIDHTDGGGTQERKVLGMGKYFNKQYESVKAGVKLPGLRVLCHNCNQSIGLYSYCPHSHSLGNV